MSGALAPGNVVYDSFCTCICCQNTARFGVEVIRWCSDLRKVINHLSDVDIFFGIQERKDYLFGSFFARRKNSTCTILDALVLRVSLVRDLAKFIYLRE